MTEKNTQPQASGSLSLPSPDKGRAKGLGPIDPRVVLSAIDECATVDDLLQVLLELAGSIYPSLNWLYGEIPDADDPVEVEILAYSPTRLKTVYQGMRIPILVSPFSRRLYEEHHLSYVGEDNGTLSHLNPQFVETFALTSFMGIPLLFEGRIIGILYAATFKGEKASVPSEAQQAALLNLARAGVLALHRIRTRSTR